MCSPVFQLEIASHTLATRIASSASPGQTTRMPKKIVPDCRSQLRMADHTMMNLTLMVLLIAGILTSAMGCTSSSRGSAPGLVLLVPGVAGDGSWYRHVVPALRAAGDERTLESFRWGAPAPAFFLNFNNTSIHESAERKLAERITTYRTEHPKEPLDIIAHSAGGGVTLGALAKLPAGIGVDRIILLHPSVSPGYPLARPLAACDSITLFHSNNDRTFLEWRTGNFGTYDNVKTKAAGNVGFDLTSLNSQDRTRVVMYPHSDADRSLGNDGDHFGALSRAFLQQRVVPILARPVNADVPAQ